MHIIINYRLNHYNQADSNNAMTKTVKLHYGIVVPCSCQVHID